MRGRLRADGPGGGGGDTCARTRTKEGPEGPSAPDGASARVVVLKFGSSLLDGPGGYRMAVEEIGRWVARGHRLLVVVSARRGRTDELLREARAVTGPRDGAEMGDGSETGSGAETSFGPVVRGDAMAAGSDATAPCEPSLVARLLRTGEEASVALLGLAAARAGLSTAVLGADELGLRTTGPVDDAEPVDVDLAALRIALGRHAVAIVPGFVGRNARGWPTLLGRGGSDYTALYLGSRVGAAEIRLVKDVDGVFEGDPGELEARPLASASWDDVERVGGGVVQSKALRFAEREGLGFRVAAPGGRGTRVGGGR